VCNKLYYIKSAETELSRQTTNFSQLVHGFLQLSLFLIQSCLSSTESLAFWLHDTVYSTIELHRTDPHAERLCSKRDTANNVWLKVWLYDVGSDLLEYTVRDVVFVEVDQLLDEVWISCEPSCHTQRCTQSTMLYLKQCTSLGLQYYLSYIIFLTRCNW